MDTRIIIKKTKSDGSCHGCCFWANKPLPHCHLINHEDRNSPFCCIDRNGENYIFEITKEGDPE